MKIVNILNNKGEIYDLQPDCLNLIHFSSGRLILPKVSHLSQLKIVFTELGKYYIDGGEHLIRLGSTEGKVCSLYAGISGYDTQPTFLFSPEKNKWFIISQGDFIFYSEEELKNKDFYNNNS
ncbi:MAG: hypothetical protein C5B43_03050 [Verrucomicrobia bacterium]|nr:MAG: hypothetical protein C5B43_03050 [Verrucomicrobiota bacterium]